MFTVTPFQTDKPTHYQELAVQLTALLSGEHDWIANSAQFSAFLYYSLPDLNWAGFYFLQQEHLIVGPFQGKPACVRINIGKGACGVCAEQRQPIIIDDVYTFPGYISCDAITRSEIVLPMIKNQQLLGVLDLDSPVLARFDEHDRQGLETLIAILLNGSTISTQSNLSS